MTSDSEAIQSANAGRGYGVCALAGFGALWFYNALTISLAPAWTLIVMWIGAVALIFGGILMIRKGRSQRAEVRRDPKIARWFWIVFAAEIVIIAALANLFQRWHLEGYILPAIAIIVGIHFIPLARLFHAPLYYITAAALVLWAVLTIVILPEERARTVAVAYGSGAILWITALIVLMRPRR